MVRHGVWRQLAPRRQPEPRQPGLGVGRRRRLGRLVRQHVGHERDGLAGRVVEQSDHRRARDAGQRAERRLHVAEAHLEAADLDRGVEPAEHLQLPVGHEPRAVARAAEARRVVVCCEAERRAQPRWHGEQALRAELGRAWLGLGLG